MTDSLVLDLQRDSIDENINVSQLLKRAYFVSRKLHLTEMQNFFESEMNGYTDHVIPPFRFIKGAIIVHDGKKEEEIKTPTDHTANYKRLRLSIPEIERTYHANKGEYFYFNLDDDKIEQQIIVKLQNRYNDMASKLGYDGLLKNFDYFTELAPKHKIYLKVNKLSYAHILDIIRWVITSWSLKLEEEGYVGESFSFTNKEMQMSVQNNYHINNLNGILGDVINSNITQNNTSSFKENESLLRGSLKENKVSDEDIEEITEILKTSETPKNMNNLPAKVNGWMKKMLDKSLDGTWEIGIATAGTLLSQAISLYYGLI